MFLTEEQAREKWCPQARTARVLAEKGDVPTVAVSANRSTNGTATELSVCLASRCMAWREAGLQHDPTKGENVITGYCGLAGRPE